MPQREKRRFPRVKAAGISAYLKLDAKTAACVVEDISAGGLLLRTERLMPVGTNISLDLVDTDARKAVQLSGQVVGVILREVAARRGEQPGMRVRFHRQAGATLAYIQKLLARLGAPDSAAPVFSAVVSPLPKQKRKLSPLDVAAPPVLAPAAGGPESTRAAPQEEGGALSFGEQPFAEPRTVLHERFEDGEEEATNTEPVPGRAALPRLTPQPPIPRAPSGMGSVRSSAPASGPPPPPVPAAPDPGERSELQRTVVELTARLSNRERELAAIEHRAALMEQDIAQRDREIADLKAEVKRLRVQLAGDDVTPVPARPRR